MSLLAFVMFALVVTGCRIPDDALDGPLVVPLRITATAEAIEVDAPGWFAAQTTIFLCAAEPPPLPPPGDGRVGWSPGGACQDFGTVASQSGLKATLRLDDVSGAFRAPLSSATDWYVLLVKRDGDRAADVLYTRFHAPSGFSG